MKTQQILNNYSKVKSFRFLSELFFIAIVPLLIGVVLWLFHKFSLLSALKLWVNVNLSGEDSWAPMQLAVNHMMASKNLLYQELFFNAKLKFQYPPTSLLLHKILILIDINPTFGLLNKINWLLIFANSLLASILGIGLARRLRSTTLSFHEFIATGALSFLACLLFYPVLKAYTQGQAQVWINFLFAMTCVSWFYNKKYLAGAAIGLICLIKPQFSLFFFWGLLRGQKEFVAGWLSSVLTGLALSVFFFGLNNHLDYLTVLGELSKTGEAYYPNQSINGLLNRLLNNGSTMLFEANAFPPYNAIVRWGTLLSSGIIVLSALFYGNHRKPTLLDFQLAALAFTMASPIAWEHHYGILPLIFISVYFGLKRFSHDDKRKSYYLILSASYVLAANFFATTYLIAEPPLNILYSYLFFGSALLVFLICILVESLNKTGVTQFESGGTGAERYRDEQLRE